MEKKEKSEDNINSLCKKYFTPELCEEVVTDTKHTLERKLCFQLEKYGHKIINEQRSKYADDVEDVLIFTISECFKKWKENAPKTSYTAYFSTALKNNFAKVKQSTDEKFRAELSLQSPSSSADEKKSLEDTIEDDKYNFIESAENCAIAKEQLECIEKAYRAKLRSDWLKALITQVLYADLHKYFGSFADINSEKFCFIDMNVFNWEHEPSQKEIADYLGKDAGQMSKAIKNFFLSVKEVYQKEAV